MRTFCKKETEKGCRTIIMSAPPQQSNFQGPIDAPQFHIKKFAMASIPQDAVCVFIGRRRTGKSTLVRDLLFHHQSLPCGMVISGTEESNEFYSSIMPPLFIHGAYEPAILNNYVKRQKLIMQKVNIQEKARQGKPLPPGTEVPRQPIDPRSFLILDDCLYDDSWVRDKNISYLFLNGRWLKVFFLITMQYPLGIPPIYRTNVDYVFILREPYPNNRRRIFENFGGAFPTFEFFCQIMDQCTENYECLVVNNNTRSNKLEDAIFWYKAQIHGDFRIGAPNFWKHNANFYRDKDEENVNIYNPNENRRLRGPAVQIRKQGQ